MSPDAAAAAINALNGPIVYIDTCSLLDLARGRDTFSSDHARASVDILQMAEARQIAVVLPGQVISEFHARLAEVRDTGRRSVDQANERIMQMAGILQAYGAALAQGHQLTGVGFLAAADTVLARYLTIAIVSDTTQETTSRAVQRTLAGQAPAAPGKDAFKDCVVIESCYDTLNRLRAVTNAQPAFFLSANTAEYAEPTTNKRGLNLQLVPEFGALGMTYAVNFLELRYSSPLHALP